MNQFRLDLDKPADPKDLETEVRRLLAIWIACCSPKIRWIQPIRTVIDRLKTISEVFDYDLGCRPTSGLSPKKWEAYYKNSLPLDPRCTVCASLNQGNHGIGCM